jgi:hypothetical protein
MVPQTTQDGYLPTDPCSVCQSTGLECWILQPDDQACTECVAIGHPLDCSLGAQSESTPTIEEAMDVVWESVQSLSRHVKNDTDWWTGLAKTAQTDGDATRQLQLMQVGATVAFKNMMDQVDKLKQAIADEHELLGRVAGANKGERHRVYSRADEGLTV